VDRYWTAILRENEEHLKISSLTHFRNLDILYGFMTACVMYKWNTAAPPTSSL
jgi:hypothetical protein